jgi:hypothetical protein
LAHNDRLVRDQEANPGPDAPLQFEQVEFATAAAAGKACALCKSPIAETYFEVGGNVLCPACSEKLTGQGGGRAAFVRAWLWGGGAAVLGTIVWFAIMKLANMELGLVAVAVGYAVGLAVRRGSRGRGGWKYQVLAMFLTYASIVTSYIPFVLKGAAEAAKKQDAAEQAKNDEKSGVKADDGTPEAAAARQEAAARASAAKRAPRPKPTPGEFLFAVLMLFGFAFAAPFLAGTSGFMGLIIIAIALYEAWKLNRRIPVTGPFRIGPAMIAPPGAPAGTP